MAMTEICHRWKGMTMADWRKKPEHIDWLRELQKDDRFRDFMSVLMNNLPVPDNGDAFQAGVTKGYSRCLSNIVAMLEPMTEIPAEIPIDYLTPDEPVEDTTQ